MVGVNILFHAIEDTHAQESHMTHPGSKGQEMARQGHESPGHCPLYNIGVIFSHYADFCKTKPC